MGIKMASGSKKLLKKTFFLAKLNDKGIVTGFYDKK